jgi:hypothetical protein
MTRKKNEKLLLVLDYPQIPLHNNPAEIALRELVIKKKISYITLRRLLYGNWLLRKKSVMGRKVKREELLGRT